MAERIRTKLTDGLHPRTLDIVDESAKHAGHAGHLPGGETHFDVMVVSSSFAGRSRVARHRLVYRLLADELRDGVHALALTTLTPDEAAQGSK